MSTLPLDYALPSKISRWIPLEWVEMTNYETDPAVVDQIYRNFSFDSFGALPGIFTGGKFRITDGNHRCRAARLRGHKHIPIVILTLDEYEHIAYTKNHLDFVVFRSDFTFEKYPSSLCIELPSA